MGYRGRIRMVWGSAGLLSITSLMTVWHRAVTMTETEAYGRFPQKTGPGFNKYEVVFLKIVT